MTSLTTATVTNQSNSSTNETATHHYMRQYVDYLENGMDFPELSQIRQLDAYLQDCYGRFQELADKLRLNNNDSQENTQSSTEIQNRLINVLQQIKSIGDKKMELSQQMLDATERQSKKLKLAQQKYIESVNQQNSLTDNSSNNAEPDDEYDSESGNQRPSSTKTSTTSLWKRKGTPSTSSSSTVSTVSTNLYPKRRYGINLEQNDRLNAERKRPSQRSANSNVQYANNGNGKRIRLNYDSSTTQSDETTYCLCSQLSYGSMILCDSKTCEIKWFHFNCVNLTTKPKGKWYCPNCRESRL